MYNLKKGKCVKCNEKRLLDSNNVCIFCSKEFEPVGKTVKIFYPDKQPGNKVISKTGLVKDNFWMAK